ncbi:MAG: sigma-70 family RNA polymerase sigma factor [Myxococcota bacterium]
MESNVKEAEDDARDRDAALLGRVAAGERAAFDALHRAHYRSVVRLATGIVGSTEEARDVAQDVFVALLRVAPQWQPDARVSTWLRRTTFNVSMTTRRRVARWWRRATPTGAAPVGPERATALADLAMEVGACLDQLSPRQRATVTLHLDEGLTPAEIAETLGMTPNAARLALSKGLRALRAEKGEAVRELGTEGAGR